MIEAATQTLTTDISHEYIAFQIKHLIIEILRRKHSIVVHCSLSLSHDNFKVLIGILDVEVEGLFLEFFNHRDISDLEISDAQFKHF